MNLAFLNVERVDSAQQAENDLDVIGQIRLWIYNLQ